MIEEEGQILPIPSELPSNPGPTPLTRVPIAPNDLNDVAQEHWREIVRHLKTLGRLYAEDQPAIKALCQVYSDKERARDTMDATRNTEVFLKYQRSYNEAFKLYTGFLKEFGLTPNSRNKMKPEKAPTKKDPLDAI